MDRVSDFYSKPSIMSVYPTYGRSKRARKQRGGQYGTAPLKLGNDIASSLLKGILYGMAGVQGIVRAKQAAKRRQ